MPFGSATPCRCLETPQKRFQPHSHALIRSPCFFSINTMSALNTAGAAPSPPPAAPAPAWVLEKRRGEGSQRGQADGGLSGKGSSRNYFVLVQQGDELVAFPVDNVVTFKPPLRCAAGFAFGSCLWVLFCYCIGGAARR